MKGNDMKRRMFDRVDALLAVANAIDILCEDNKLTHSDFARKIGSHPSTVSMYTRQNTLPSIDVLMNISIKFNVSVDWVLGLSDEK